LWAGVRGFGTPRAESVHKVPPSTCREGE
jgi:hypothetical protein